MSKNKGLFIIYGGMQNGILKIVYMHSKLHSQKQSVYWVVYLIVVTFVKFQPILGPLGPVFDRFCVNNITKTSFYYAEPICDVICTGTIKDRPQWTQYWLKFHIFTVLAKH